MRGCEPGVAQHSGEFFDLVHASLPGAHCQAQDVQRAIQIALRLTGNLDVAALAESMLRVHEAHRGLVDDDTARRAESRDLVLLARGRIRQRRYTEAAAELDRAASLAPLEPRERMLRALVRVPGARAALGRRRPYR